MSIQFLRCCLVFLICFMIGTESFSQYVYNKSPEFLNANIHWAFGQGSGLDFSSGTAVPFSTSIIGNEGHASVSDPLSGKLLFYTNGGSVWNASHQLMPNGIGLMGNSNRNMNGENYTTSQGALIVPFISDSNKYYLFSLAPNGSIHSDFNSGKSGSLFYNVVDMTLDQGNGDVDTNYKNIVLDTTSLNEALIAIPGCSNDIWVLVHSSDQDSNFYKAYHITENGVNPSPILSASRIGMGNENEFVIGALTISPDRKKIVLTRMLNSLVELSSFDPSSGKVFDPILIDPGVESLTKYYSAAFSPDNSKLYISNINAYTMTGSLIQYDVVNLDSALIGKSKEVVDSTLPFVSLRLYNDTIYATSYFMPSIHRINQPNNPGLSCEFEPYAIVLNGGNLEGALGNDVVLAIPYDTMVTMLDTTICAGWADGISISAKDTFSISYIWNTGDTTTSINIQTAGTYWVKYNKCNQIFTDTFIIKGSNIYTSITINEFELGVTGGPFASYQWYFNGDLIPGATNSVYQIHGNGDYTVEVTDEYGCIFMSEIYKVTNYTSVNDLSILKEQIKIYPNPASDRINILSPVTVKAGITSIEGNIVLNPDITTEISLAELADGMYLLQIYDIKGSLIRIEKLVKKQ